MQAHIVAIIGLWACLAGSSLALLGEPTNNVVNPEQHRGTLHSCLDGLHLQQP